MSKRRDAYDLGKDYSQYRQKKKSIKGEIKEIKKKEKEKKK